jgi:hypothetical protein
MHSGDGRGFQAAATRLEVCRSDPFPPVARDNLGPNLAGENGPKQVFFSGNRGVFAEKRLVNDHNMTLLWSFS